MSGGKISISYPLLTAFFCSSIRILSISVILRFIILIASVWSILLIWILTARLDCISRKFFKSSSVSSGARICKNDTAPMVFPILKVRPSEKSKEVGAIKSFVVSPVFAIRFHEKLSLLPSPLKQLCNSSSRSMPLNGKARTPNTLKLFKMSASIRSNRCFAFWILSASIPNVIYFFRTMPLFPRGSWPFSISVYSSRMSLNSSSRDLMSIAFSYSEISMV